MRANAGRACGGAYTGSYLARLPEAVKWDGADRRVIHAERCSVEPWPGSGECRIGPDAGAVAIRATLVHQSCPLVLHRRFGPGSVWRGTIGAARAALWCLDGRRERRSPRVAAIAPR